MSVRLTHKETGVTISIFPEHYSKEDWKIIMKDYRHSTTEENSSYWNGYVKSGKYAAAIEKIKSKYTDNEDRD